MPGLVPGRAAGSRPPPVSDVYLAGPKRDCAMLPADLSLKAARQIARWYEDNKDEGDQNSE